MTYWYDMPPEMLQVLQQAGLSVWQEVSGQLYVEVGQGVCYIVARPVRCTGGVVYRRVFSPTCVSVLTGDSSVFNTQCVAHDSHCVVHRPTAAVHLLMLVCSAAWCDSTPFRPRFKLNSANLEACKTHTGCQQLPLITFLYIISTPAILVSKHAAEAHSSDLLHTLAHLCGGPVPSRQAGECHSTIVKLVSLVAL
jgi:hypothetical protein